MTGSTKRALAVHNRDNGGRMEERGRKSREIKQEKNK